MTGDQMTLGDIRAPDEPGQRREGDRYYTPPALAAALLDLPDGPDTGRWGHVLEPSAGGGAFVDAAIACGARGVVAVDQDPAAPVWERHRLGSVRVWGVCADFLQYNQPLVDGYNRFDACIGNPPYARPSGRLNGNGDPIMEPIAEQHIRHALSLVRPGGDVCMLLRLGVLASASRVSFWEEFPARKVWPIAQRPREWPASFDYMWAHWRVGWHGETRLGPPVVWR